MSPRKRPPDPWPWPADTPTERARRVAWSYRQELAGIAPDRCAKLDARTQELGQAWIVPQLAVYTPDDQLTTDEVAEFCGVQPATVDTWTRRGLPHHQDPDGHRRFVMRDVLDYHAENRRRRGKHGQSGQTVVP